VLNDELGPMIVLLLIVLVQAWLFALIIRRVRKRPIPGPGG
jgi:flagellar biogenesis protein FliO